MLPRLVFISMLVAPLCAGPPSRFAGAVRAGQIFRKEIGSGLVFVLSPSDDRGSGWTIEVRPADDSDNFVRCVTFPLHGPTEADILSWQFVTEDNERLPEATLATLKRRNFQFVLNRSDQKRACNEMSVVAEGPTHTAKDGTLVVGTPGYKSPLLGEGTFYIKAIQLSGIGRSKHATFDSLSFTVEIMLPSGRGSLPARDHQ